MPQWKLDEAASEAKLQTALVEHAHAVLHVAGIPTAPVLEVDTPRAESEPAIGKLYQKYQITTSGNTIRLLTLVPGEGSILKATMSCADLSSSPTYEALSYVWGTMENCSEHFLHIDDTILEITPNLYRALHALRSRQSPRVLWVDAVCINQNDNRDKETQICLMEDIYKKANHVVVYLGEPADISAHLLSFLDRDVPEDHSAVEALTHLGHNDMRQLLEAFIHFCQLPWWNRIWVQQEYLLAQTHPTFCLGHSSFHVSALLRDWGILQRELALNILPFAGDVNLELNLQMMSWQPIMRQVLHVHGVLTLRSALGRSEYPYLWLPRGVLKKVNLRCTNPRDRIYGMRSNLDPVARAFFTPNYTESVEVAFHRLAAWLLAIDQWQQVFWWYPHRLSPNLPSWVPDFTRPLPEAAFSERNLFDYGKLKKSSPCPLAIRDGILAMEGYLLDTVSHVYAIDQPDWPSTVRELWFLESIFADLPSSTMLRKAPPIFNTLPGLHTRDPLQNWMSPTIKSAKRSIVFELSPFNCFEKDDILKSVFDPFLNGIKDIAKLHTDIIESLVAQLRELSSEVTRSNLQARIPINLQIHEHLQVVSAFTEIRLRLSTLSLFLQRSNHTATDLFGAALFDYPNLLDQILHLRKPSLPCHFPASQISTISARLRTVNGPSNDNTSPPDWIPHNPSGLIARVQPIYEILQHQITACVFPEEVTMRARLILAYATAIRTFPTTFSTNPKPTSTTSYHHLRDQRIQSTTTLIQTLAEDNAAQEALNQLILAESHTYFSALATQFPDDADVAATLAQYHSVLAESKVSSATLKETIETQSKKLEEAMLDIRTNTMYHHNAQAFERDAFEISTSLSNRTFFSTEYGLVGVGCQGVRDVRVGDKLVVLRGTEFPMVVREVEEGMHEIVGYSIVRGFGYEDFEKLGRFEKPVRQAFYFR